MILGLDVATSTGWAFSRGRVCDGEGERAIMSGVLKVNNLSHAQASWRLGSSLCALIKAHGKPKYCFIEAPVILHKGSRATAKSHMLCGAVLGVLSGFKIPFEMVRCEVWRGAMFGFSRRRGWVRNDWKNHARQHCRYLGLEICCDDEAEAILISQYGYSATAYKAKTQGIVDTVSRPKPKKRMSRQYALKGVER